MSSRWETKTSVMQLAECEMVARIERAMKGQFRERFRRLKRTKSKLKLTLILISCKEIGTGWEYKKQVSH